VQDLKDLPSGGTLSEKTRECKESEAESEGSACWAGATLMA
jgi:hypothetical protein